MSFNTSATCVRQLCTRFRTFTPSTFLHYFARLSNFSIRYIIDPFILYFLPPPSITEHVPSMAWTAIVKIVWKNLIPRLSTSISIPILSPLSPAQNQSNDLTHEVNERVILSRTCYHVLPFPFKDLSPVFDGFGGAIINSSTRRGC